MKSTKMINAGNKSCHRRTIVKPNFSFLIVLLISVYSFPQNKQQIPRRILPKENATAESMKAGAFIDVNVSSYAPSSYAPPQLVNDILIKGGTHCSAPNVTNVKVSPGHTATDDNRFWGYFHKAATNFPFRDGLVLTTGFARQAGNSVISSPLEAKISLQGDADLAAATNTNIAEHYDAVALEFDFVPYSNKIKFNYLFASEEYTGIYPCSYSDAFAILIKPVAGGPYVNVAVLPGGAGPISVTNIHPANFACAASNESYFAGYNTANVETNFKGRTIPLTALADVTPGVAYHFKMVLCDYKDQKLDTAVFLEGGSFDIGVKIVDGANMILPDTIYLCDHQPQILKASVAPTSGMTFQWFKDGIPVSGATNIAYTATVPGIYEVKVSVPGNQCPGSAKITIIGGLSPTVQNAVLKMCTTTDAATFNLNTAISMISTTVGAVFRFYENQADAVAQNNNHITNLTNYNGTDGQILYVLVSNGAFCSKIATLTLKKEETPTALLTASRLKICAGESVLVTASGGATYLWSDSTGTTSGIRTVNPTQTTTYSVHAIGAQGCKSPVPARLTIEVVPAIVSTLKGGPICDRDMITLDAGSGPEYTYQWSSGETTQTITTAIPGEYSVKISNGVCSEEFKAQVIRATIPEIKKADYNENGTMMLKADNPSNSTLEYSIDNGMTWQSSNIFHNVPRNKIIPIRIRVKNTSCVSFLEYFTFIMQNVITPNGDHLNDIIDFRGLNKYENFSASIFDRYGKEVYKAEKTKPYWDGYFQGKRLPTASYWYQVAFESPVGKEKIVKTGWILLKNFE
ncbi:choice-of-anchor L domain-containing protein [Chryseobacterium fluminis]|uniref:choice-of-anchor L domain-containing protein n=1 Tax=Chryseobacterium fluminis TaxID=2983606 RepID=UPI002259E123|nr:choice-of-anchor L domain-containing protein [Chryseobacterium sp. MMS21-Ot14]UZT97907.1 choice-of-anchor L domain-containing protein [Chryseobacterium sp. MMS21-Ot14]